MRTKPSTLIALITATILTGCSFPGEPNRVICEKYTCRYATETEYQKYLAEKQKPIT